MRHAMLVRKHSDAAVPKSKTAAKAAPDKLRIGEPDDSLEQEADRMADEVMLGGRTKPEWSFSRISVDAPLQRKCSCGGSAGSEGECEECKAEKTLRRKPAGAVEAGVAPPIVHEVLRSPGQPLDAATRAFFEPRFGHDFSRVRVHIDAHAGNSAKAVNAHAYTAGNDIVFDTGRYSPTCAKGRKLLAHELAHTVQQRPVLSRQAKKDDDPANRPLPPHDASAHFGPVGACYGSAICRDLITPSKLLAEAAADPQNKAKREHRKQVCQSKPPDPACTAGGHGSGAPETAELLHDYDSSRPVPGTKFLINKDLEREFRALTMSCSDFMPPVSGATTCITVPDETEKEAAQFNNTMDPTIGGEERGKWRERMVEILVHESEHARFRAAYKADKVLAKQPACATSDTVSAMNELTAMLTEFPIRMERIRTSVGLSAEDKQKELDEWREHRILGERQSITVSLRTVRCAYNCDDANKMIRETVEFTTASWTQQQKNDLHRELRDPRWSDLDLRWPFVAPPIPSVSGPGLQRKPTGPVESGIAPPVVHEVLNSPGRPLDEATRKFFEPRYGHDFSNVRKHHDQQAEESAAAVDALAYTVGSDIVFAHGQHAPDSIAGRRLLAHELTHVVQGRNPGSTNGPGALHISSSEGAAEREADDAVDKIETGQPLSATSLTEPAIHRKQAGTAKVPNGEFSFRMAKKPNSLKEDVYVAFSPDASGPSTKVIKFIQIVRLTDSQTGQSIPWGEIKPGESIKDKLGPQKTEGNVQAGFLVDVDPQGLKPREKASDPSLSPEYPHLEGSYSGGSIGPRPGCVGCDPPLGKRDVTMVDTGPGGISGRDITFEFESAAYSEDLGVFYGAVHWGFRQAPASILSDAFPGEWFSISPGVSETLRASIVAFNKALKNRHRVLQGETLAGISSTYFGTPSAAQAIFELNRDALKDPDPVAPLPPGVELELPTRWERAKFSQENKRTSEGDSQNPWERAKLQRSATGEMPSPIPAIVHEVLRSPGQPLDQATRTFFEPRFGRDFSKVRVHADAKAAAAAKSVGSLAYTVGEDVVFGSGFYNPMSNSGRRLLAHELTHVVQQGNPSGGVAQATAAESEAATVARLIDKGERSQVSLTAPPSIQRQPGPTPLPHLDLAESASPFAAAAFGSVTLDGFDTGKADIPGPGQAELARTVETIWKLLKQYPASTIHVIGYTDAVGQESDNQALGQARADSVQAALLAAGLPAVSIHAESRGAAELRVTTKKGEPRNRRVEVRFETSRRFSGVMSSGLTSTPMPSPGPTKTGVPSPADFCAQNPTLCLGKQGGGGGPSVPPAATQPLPSGTPFELMDIPALNEPFISHGRNPQEGGDLRETWAQLYWKYRLSWHLSKEQAAKAANSELSSTAGSSESRDNPNAVDRTNRDMQQAYPNATSVGPFNLPYKWRF